MIDEVLGVELKVHFSVWDSFFAGFIFRGLGRCEASRSTENKRGRESVCVDHGFSLAETQGDNLEEDGGC